jgi:YVTN family beta-propeller protein
MRFKRRLAVLAASAAALVGGVASVGLTAGPAAAATTTTSVTLPLSYYSHMVVDPVHKYLFISSAADNEILVTDYSGNTVATIANLPGAYGLTLSSNDGTLYVALSGSNEVAAINTGTLTETASYSTGADFDPYYVAYADGKVWFGYNGNFFNSGIGSIDTSTNPATVTLNATNDPAQAWTGAPDLSASPNGYLVAGQGSTVQLASYDVSSGTAVTLAPPTSFNGLEPGGLVASSFESFQITPDGKDVVVASSAPYYQQVYRVSDLSTVGKYPTGTYPDGVSIAINGTVAAGAGNYSNTVYIYVPGGSTPLNTYQSYGSASIDGVALSPDGSELFDVTSAAGSFIPDSNPVLNIISDPVQGASTLSVTGPATDNKDQPITLTGTLGGTSPYAGGQTLHVTRTDPANPNGVALPDVTTAADGSFTITDRPPKANVDSATVTYKVSYAGDAYLTGSSASASVTVRYNNS